MIILLVLSPMRAGITKETSTNLSSSSSIRHLDLVTEGYISKAVGDLSYVSATEPVS